jgi:serine/threonine protein kinase/Tol biopolymer transport system component
MIGQLVGHYRVLDKIGAGGMGEVFRARDERLARDVALKLIRPSSTDNPDHLRRFEQEARAAAALNHPNILAIYDVGFEGKSPYIVSELLEGQTLRQRLMEGGFPVREAAGYALQIAQGLTAAHERHIIHRDLKPENLFLTNDSRIKILDFGVAKLQPDREENRSPVDLTTVTKTGAVIGTVAYMSPEQLRGKTVDPRSDIFSFGAIFYELLSGERAFRGETEVDTMTAVLREEPPAVHIEQSTIPVAYREIVRHCLEKDPDNRFQSSKDLVFALQTLTGSSQISTISLFRPKPRIRRILPWILAGALAAAALVLGVMLLTRAPAAATVYSRVTFEAGTVYAARFAPKGETILYSAAWDNSPTQVFSTVANSTLTQRLQLGNANLLAVSRSSELALATGGIHSGQMETVNGMLSRAPFAGGSPREVLSEVRWADWDSSGKLAVVHYVEGQGRLEYPIGHVIYQSGGWISHIRLSPKGDAIAFVDHPALWDSRGSLRVVDLSGQTLMLTREWDSALGLAWSSNGKEVWFSAAESGDDQKLMAANLSGKVRTVLDLPSSIALQDIAPDGRVLVSLYSRRLAMGYARRSSSEDVDLSWHDSNAPRDISMDGRFVVFDDSSAAAGSGYAVALRKTDGALPTRLGEGGAGGLSPDGKWAISIANNQSNQVTLLPTGAGEPRSIRVIGPDRVHNVWARFLPDGQHIALVGDQTGHASRCYLLDINTGQTKPATPEGITCGPISPDGHSMVKEKGNKSLGFYSLDTGTEERVLSNLKSDLTPTQWSNSGKLLFGYHWGEFPSKVYQLDIATGNETLVRELKPGASAGIVLVAPVIASRDGNYFAYSYNQTLSVLYLVSGLR